jgi:hypothetical protein
MSPRYNGTQAVQCAVVLRPSSTTITPTYRIVGESYQTWPQEYVITRPMAFIPHLAASLEHKDLHYTVAPEDIVLE